jgi:hypothetical protein
MNLETVYYKVCKEHKLIHQPLTQVDIMYLYYNLNMAPFILGKSYKLILFSILNKMLEDAGLYISEIRIIFALFQQFINSNSLLINGFLDKSLKLENQCKKQVIDNYKFITPMMTIIQKYCKNIHLRGYEKRLLKVYDNVFSKMNNSYTFVY